MKFFTVLFLTVLLNSCTQQIPTAKQTKTTESTLTSSYIPGLGEIMIGIQSHHAKLWFAGINANWKLSTYEITELKEMFETAIEFQAHHREEVKNIPMIYADLDQVSKAIEQQDVETFKNSFQSLTHTCNACHQLVKYEYIAIIIPTAKPVVNQDFKVK